MREQQAGLGVGGSDRARKRKAGGRQHAGDPLLILFISLAHAIFMLSLPSDSGSASPRSVLVFRALLA